MIGTKFVLNRFFLTTSFLSCPFTLNCSSFNIATLGLHLGFSVWLKIWQVSVCKMEPQSGYIMQPEPSSLLDQSEISAGLQDVRWSNEVAPNLNALTNLA